MGKELRRTQMDTHTHTERAEQPHLLADKGKQTDNLSVHPALLLPSVNPPPTALPMEPPGSSHPWTLPAPWGKQQPMQSWLCSCPRAICRANFWGRDPHPIAPWQAQAGWSMCGSSQAGRRQSQSGGEPWWPLFWPYGCMNLV